MTWQAEITFALISVFVWWMGFKTGVDHAEQRQWEKEDSELAALIAEAEETK